MNLKKAIPSLEKGKDILQMDGDTVFKKSSLVLSVRNNYREVRSRVYCGLTSGCSIAVCPFSSGPRLLSCWPLEPARAPACGF